MDIAKLLARPYARSVGDAADYLFGRFYLPEESLDRGNPNSDVYRGWAQATQLATRMMEAVLPMVKLHADRHCR
jgi:hypothetical protein